MLVQVQVLSPAISSFNSRRNKHFCYLPVVGSAACSPEELAKTVVTVLALRTEESRAVPKLMNTTPKYRKHKATGQAVVTVAGHDHYLGPHGTKTSRSEYDRVVGEWIAAGRPSHHVAAQAGITIAELAAAYLHSQRGLRQERPRHGRDGQHQGRAGRRKSHRGTPGPSMSGSHAVTTLAPISSVCTTSTATTPD